MAKIRNPLLSFEAHGTLADKLTFQRQVKQSRLRTKPIPVYRNTLLQQYRRWLYKDAIFAWKEQTPGKVALWRAYGSRHHLPPMAAFIGYYLRYLPDIALMFYLDETSGTLTHDASSYHTHGTMFGPSPIKGIIGHAQHFTLDDYIETTCPQADFTDTDFSIVAHIFLDTLTANNVIYERGRVNTAGIMLRVQASGRIDFFTSGSYINQRSQSALNSVVPLAWHTIGINRQGPTVTPFVNGIDLSDISAVHVDPDPTAMTALLGIRDDKVSQPLNGIIDHFILYNRAITPAHHLDHSLRRYPP